MKRVLQLRCLRSAVPFCERLRQLAGQARAGTLVPRPDSVLDAAALYKENCAGCHGQTGRGGVATPIGLPEYQSLVDEATQLNIVTNGVPHTAMPGFSRKAGGFLTDEQIAALVKGMRATWLSQMSQPDKLRLTQTQQPAILRWAQVSTKLPARIAMAKQVGRQANPAPCSTLRTLPLCPHKVCAPP